MDGYRIEAHGASRSFPSPHAFLDASTPTGRGRVFVGTGAGAAYGRTVAGGDRLRDATFVAIELGTECLGVHTGEDGGREGSNVLGFARFRLGDGEPSDLVELVRQPATEAAAIAAAKAAFEGAGLKVAVCGDFPGRILDRLVRPYFNAVLRRLDEGLAAADDLDTTLCLGLGYPEGPVRLLHRTGLAHHFRISEALFEALGDPAYAPARRARVAAQREGA